VTDLKTVMPQTTGDKQMALNAFSILAMVLYFNLARPLITRFLDGHDEVDFNNRLIDHIVEFSLNGIGAGQEEVR
jgi:hypothetical protein